MDPSRVIDCAALTPHFLCFMATREKNFLRPPFHRFLEDETRDANIIRLRASPLPEQRAVGKCMHEKQHMRMARRRANVILRRNGIQAMTGLKF